MPKKKSYSDDPKFKEDGDLYWTGKWVENALRYVGKTVAPIAIAFLFGLLLWLSKQFLNQNNVGF